MTVDEEKVMSELEKIKFHISLLGETIDYKSSPVQYLVISKDWSREDLNKAHDIFEKWNKKIRDGEEISRAGFENDFRKALDLSYQGVKGVVNAFWRAYQWVEVCEAFVDSFGPSPSVEYHAIRDRDRS